MERLLQSVKITINDKIFLKDPESSTLGKNIIKNSIDLIDEIGLEHFTFKKLSARIGSTESSIYRYFENKHKLLIYLTSWYWGWLEFLIVFETNSIKDPKEKIARAIAIVSEISKKNHLYTHIDEVILNRIVINESFKSFLTKEVDQENKDGYFVIYKRMVNRFEDLIKEVSPSYKYARSLASTILESTLYQHFLSDHFPNLTNCTDQIRPHHFTTDMVFKALST